MSSNTTTPVPAEQAKADAARIIEQLNANQAAAEQAGLSSPQLEEFNNLLVGLVGEAADPKATIAAVSELLVRQRAVRPGHRLVPALIGTINHHQIAHIECPDWCEADHMDEPCGLEEITHSGDEDDVEVASLVDPTTLALHWTARIAAHPSSPFAQVRAAHIVVDDEKEEALLTPEMAEELADDLDAFTAHLRKLARTVRTVTQAAEDLPAWASLSRTDLQTTPISDLLKVFGVTVVETTGFVDTLSVRLVGEPGSMQLLVHPAAPQHAREDLARKGLLAWYDARFGGDRA